MSSRGRGFIPRGGGSYRGRGGGGGNEWNSGSTGGNMSGRGGYSSSRGGRFKYSTTSYDSRSKYNSGNVQMLNVYKIHVISVHLKTCTIKSYCLRNHETYDVKNNSRINKINATNINDFL